jgi:hypothetical protein
VLASVLVVSWAVLVVAMPWVPFMVPRQALSLALWLALLPVRLLVPVVLAALVAWLVLVHLLLLVLVLAASIPALSWPTARS